MIKGSIYKITNIKTNECYIGQTTNLARRWSEHIHAFETVNTPLYLAMRQYGISNFAFQMLETDIHPADLDVKEQHYIKLYNANLHGYNILKGGKGQTVTRKLTQSDVNQIIDMLTTDIAIKDIAEQFSVNVSTISDINNGDTWNNPMQSYPIRQAINNKKHFSDDEINDIYQKLRNGMSAKKIGIEYHTSTTTISKINHGKIYRRADETYPIVETSSRPRNLTISELEDIISQLLTTNNSYIAIGRSHCVNKHTISNINNGLIYKTKLETLGYTVFPLRMPVSNKV